MTKGEDLFGISLDKGKIIFKEGDQGDTMYIIQSGAVEISQDKNGGKRVLALLEKGDFFGEMALIDKHLRSATGKPKADRTVCKDIRPLPQLRDTLN